MKVDLKSSVQKQGKTVTQIVTALSGIKKTFRGVKTETIEQGEMTHFDTEDGRTILINTKNIAWVEVFKEPVITKTGNDSFTAIDIDPDSNKPITAEIDIGRGTRSTHGLIELLGKTCAKLDCVKCYPTTPEAPKHTGQLVYDRLKRIVGCNDGNCPICGLKI